MDNCICKEYKYHEERIRHAKDIEESVNLVVSDSIKDSLPSGKVVSRHIPEICCTRVQMDSLRTEIYAWRERCRKAHPSFIPECDCGIPNARLCTQWGRCGFERGAKITANRQARSAKADTASGIWITKSSPRCFSKRNHRADFHQRELSPSATPCFK